MTINKSTKNKYFEAFLIEILKWYKEEKGTIDSNDLSKLKVLKLLFLGVAGNEKYLDMFEFRAWDLGPVEKDIYVAIKENNLTQFYVSNSKLEEREGDVDTSEEINTFAKDIVGFLKAVNTNLINLPASSLVDITHKWTCWKVARTFGSEDISKGLILKSNKYFS